MIAFIDDHRGAHGVEPICKVLPIAPSTYHAHAARRADPEKLSARAKRDMVLKPEIARVFAENFEVYGVRKVWRQLQRESFAVARCTVERLMRGMGLQGVIRGKPVRTTISDKAAPCPLDHVNRQFRAPRPNALWVSDFTYVSTWTGFVYVAFVIDVFARRIVAGSCITATEAANTSRSGIPSACRKQALSRRSAVLAIVTTMPSRKPSMVSTRPRLSIDGDRGGPWKLSSSQRSNGWTGSTIAGCWSLSATSRRLKPSNATTP